MATMTGKQLAALMRKRALTAADVARLTGYSESNVKQLLVRAQLPRHAARLMELALTQETA